MDAGMVFVLILTALSVGILVYLEMRSRGSRKATDAIPREENEDKNTQAQNKSIKRGS